MRWPGRRSMLGTRSWRVRLDPTKSHHSGRELETVLQKAMAGAVQCSDPPRHVEAHGEGGSPKGSAAASPRSRFLPGRQDYICILEPKERSPYPAPALQEEDNA